MTLYVNLCVLFYPCDNKKNCYRQKIIRGIYMEKEYCQCCGMPMGATDEMYGTEADGSKSKDYCTYCYENGTFTFTGTMEEMIEICIPHMVEANKGMSEAEARKSMQEWFPTLKRWKRDYEIIRLKEKTLVGISVITSNNDPKLGETMTGIWNNFYEDETSAKIENKINDHPICLYSDYEQRGRDILNEKYCVSIGFEVTKVKNKNLTVKTIPSGRYAKFSVQGNMYSVVEEEWQKIWQLPLERTFTGDFEDYVFIDLTKEIVTVDIYVAVK